MTSPSVSPLDALLQDGLIYYNMKVNSNNHVNDCDGPVVK